MLPDRVSNPGPLTYESGALSIAQRDPAILMEKCGKLFVNYSYYRFSSGTLSKSGSKVIKLFSCSTQLSMKFFLLINVKMPTNVGILTFMSRKNSILG